LIQLLSPKLGFVDASLAENQPYTDLNRHSEVSQYVYEAPLGANEKYFTIYAVDHQSNIASKIILIEGCEGTITFVDDKAVLPEIFDIKYSIGNSTIRPATAPHHYISENVTLPVSAIVDSPIIPLKRAELRVVTLGESEGNYTIVPMEITPLILPFDDSKSTSIVSGEIPESLIDGPAVKFWIYLVTAEGLVKESVHSIVAVRPDGYSRESSVEMDTTTIKAQGTTLRLTAYITNTAEIPVYGDVSLIADGEMVHSKPALLQPGQNIVSLKWLIPKSESARPYDVQTQIQVYEDESITSNATINTYSRTQKMPVPNLESIEYVTDEAGNAIARPALIYASNENEGTQFRVTAPDGTCVIGGAESCLVTDSTADRRGGLDSVIIGGHLYRVKYSGADNALERFSITSLDSVVGDWHVEIESESEFLAYASSLEEILLTIKYRAERGSFVKVMSE
jgi:hypothetical protein